MTTMKMSAAIRMKSLAQQSGVVSSALKLHEAEVGLDLYGQLQELERKAVSAGDTYDHQLEATQAVREKRDAAVRRLTTLNSACSAICVDQGIGTAAAYATLDRGDEPGLSAHLEGEIAKVSEVGEPLARSLRLMRKRIVGLDAQVAEAEVKRTATERQLVGVLFELQSVIAQARRALIHLGVRVVMPRAKPKPRVAPPPAANGSGSGTQPPLTPAMSALELTAPTMLIAPLQPDSAPEPTTSQPWTDRDAA